MVLDWTVATKNVQNQKKILFRMWGPKFVGALFESGKTEKLNDCHALLRSEQMDYSKLGDFMAILPYNIV